MGKTYCSSDWHGCEFYKKILNFLQEDDTLYFIGDSIDRGPAGIEVFDALYFDKRVIMLKGNHEDMLADFLSKHKLDKKTLKLYSDNGGDTTLESMKHMSEREKQLYITEINTLPEKLIYHSPNGHDVILEHAGYSPFDMPHRHHDPLWDRLHFNDPWDSGQERAGLTPANTYLVHGHTPVQTLKYYFGYINQPPFTKQDFIEKKEFDDNENNICTIKPTILCYCDNHKFDIDMCTVYSNRIALLNLDTFEVTYIDKE